MVLFAFSDSTFVVVGDVIFRDTVHGIHRILIAAVVFEGILSKDHRRAIF